jgi:Holliday junction resolvasome RuvABC endonuclease subunit
MTVTLGLDLSYTSTGLVVLNTEKVLGWDRIQTKPRMQREQRITIIKNRVMEVCDMYDLDMVMLEDYAFSKPQGATMLGELGGVVKNALWSEGIKWDKVQPMTVKLHAGSGKYDKKQMIEAARRLWPECPNVSDVADAFWIAHYARHQLLEASA